VKIPVHPGVIRPLGEMQAISVITGAEHVPPGAFGFRYREDREKPAVGGHRPAAPEDPRVPSRKIASASAEGWYPAVPPYRRDCRMPRRFNRDMAERAAGSSTPRAQSRRMRAATDSQPPSDLP
jgi:hypothetical protein